MEDVDRQLEALFQRANRRPKLPQYQIDPLLREAASRLIKLYGDKILDEFKVMLAMDRVFYTMRHDFPEWERLREQKEESWILTAIWEKVEDLTK